MAQHGKSGRIVVDLEPEEKRRLYAALSLSGLTFKEWVRDAADRFCADRDQPPLFPASETADLPTASERIASSIGVSAGNGTGTIQAPISVVSMFSGCGGMDLGFRGDFDFQGHKYHRLPFQVTWANDINAFACKTYSRNLGTEILPGDVNNVIGTIPNSADVIIGGFPCQDISINGNGAGVNGARSGLYRSMVEAISRIRPKVFVAENVAGLLNTNNESSYRQVLRDFIGLGYNVHHQVYTAADYGVPQTRERVFFVGTSLDVNSYVPPKQVLDRATWITAEQALADLEALDRDPGKNHIWSAAKKSPEQGNRRLRAERPGYTIRAECHGNIQFHYKLPRRISMREAARIQSFPDDFVFEGGLREIERQVGNAVPPVLAWHIASAVLDCLK